MNEEEQFEELERDVRLKIAETQGYLDDLSSKKPEANPTRVDRCLKEIDLKVTCLLLPDVKG